MSGDGGMWMPAMLYDMWMCRTCSGLGECLNLEGQGG